MFIVYWQILANDTEVKDSQKKATKPPPREVIGDLQKSVLGLYARVNYQFKTGELQNVEKLVKQKS